LVNPALRPNQPAVRASQRKQRWCNLCIKTCTAEVFRPASTLNHQLAPNDFRSRPARTPPSTFLFLHLNLSNNPMSQNIALPVREKFRQALLLKEDRQLIRRQINRHLSAAKSLTLMRASEARKLAWTRGPRRRRAQWPVYRPSNSDLSTPIVRKTSSHFGTLPDAEKLRFFRARAVQEPHCSGVLTLGWAEKCVTVRKFFGWLERF
jgi:hypothetical protein